MDKKLSTSKLAQAQDIKSGELFKQLESFGYISKKDDGWQLTQAGTSVGGEYITSTKFGQYIVWPSDFTLPRFDAKSDKHTASQIGERFDLPSQKINQLFAELGWITKHGKGWHLTHLGQHFGGLQRENSQSDIPFVVWDTAILSNKRLRNSINEVQGNNTSHSSTDKSYSSFRQKFEAKYRTADGHYVRSKQEMLIDNWLYMTGLVHAYERKLPIEQEVYSDFYLPKGQIYIEFFAQQLDTEQEKEKQTKLALYQQFGLHLIELNEEDIEHLDAVMPKYLRQFDVSLGK
ncbi:glycerol kinase [Vibrio tapetis subsp. quintayensis]|uniref:glycerol kinase n=1 Tax=Vibrio tapetis TaxID=52443 RepID=UPI0025B463E6|nr:glycerol kinase [Vibrio tapetis]MDN3679227.1 glycerol kinase [Vibrio tapetis subsp. quintayensis]